MSHSVLKKIQQQWHGSLKSYLIGFFLSLLLTGLSFYTAMEANLTTANRTYFLIALAIIQAIAQLIFFLHVGQDGKSGFWDSLSLYFTISILIVIVVGSLWVMSDLNMRMMPDMEMPDMQKTEKPL